MLATTEATAEIDENNLLQSNIIESQTASASVQSVLESDEEVLTEPDLDLFVIGERPVISYSKPMASIPSHNKLKNRMGFDTFQYAQKPLTKLLKALPQEGKQFIDRSCTI